MHHLFWSTTDVVDLLEVGDVVAWPVAFLCQELPLKETNMYQAEVTDDNTKI